MRWFTCTPRNYPGGEAFFARDTGLLCQGLIDSGVESRAVMIGNSSSADNPLVLRTSLSNLESTKWWQSQHLDGVVLYAWGRPRYRKVAMAIKRAGIVLVLHQDSGGIISPLSGLNDWWHDQWHLAGSFWPWLRSITRQATIGLGITDPLRAWHLRQGDHIGAPSPMAVTRYQRMARIYGGSQLADRVCLMPHAVAKIFRYHGTRKTNTIICVGRWSARDSVQKRPLRMMQVISNVLEKSADVNFCVVGEQTIELQQWHASMTPHHQARVTLMGTLHHPQLVEVMAQCQIFYCPSAYESFGIAAAEALCCGCSVVAAHSISLESFQWFISEQSGTLARADTVIGHTEALIDELTAWHRGDRSAQQISDAWCQRLHADRVAQQVMSYTLSAQ